MRISVISEFWKNNNPSISKKKPNSDDDSNDYTKIYLYEYQNYIQKAIDNGILSLEDYTVRVSSFLFSLGILVIPMILNKNAITLPHGDVISVSGAAGLVFTLVIKIIYWCKKNNIKNLKEQKPFKS